MDEGTWLAHRLASLRVQQGKSARELSLALGQSEGYINKIETLRISPSMTVFFRICAELGITPQDFFTPQLEHPQETHRLLEALSRLTETETQHLYAVVQDLLANR